MRSIDRADKVDKSTRRESLYFKDKYVGLGNGKTLCFGGLMFTLSRSRINFMPKGTFAVLDRPMMRSVCSAVCAPSCI